jgi:phage terminase large subunit-like protein
VNTLFLRVAAAQLLEAKAKAERKAQTYDWRRIARPQQILAGEPGSYSTRRDWDVFLWMAGRGFGKTRSGAEAVRGQVDAGRRRRIALVAPTLDDARKIMIEGDSGLLSVYPKDSRAPVYKEHKREIHWPNGAIGFVYTTEEPERFRGPQHDFAWCEELGAWRNAETSWDNLQFGMRITGPRGDHPQTIIGTTPRPTPLMRKIVANPGTEVAHGTTYENQANLNPRFLAKILREYEGTRLGEQELFGKLLGDTPGAMFKLSLIEAARVVQPPEDLRVVVVAIDPAVADAEGRKRAEQTQTFLAETGIVVFGAGSCRCKGTEELHGFVLEDRSGYFQPDEWAKLAVDAYEQHAADRIVAEVNNGGALVEATLKAYGGSHARFNYKAVTASRGKAIRAEPVATLYEKGEVHHVGTLSKLEDQMTTWNPLLSKKSPDRLDAVVWAATEAMLGPSAPRVARAIPMRSFARRI